MGKIYRNKKGSGCQICKPWKHKHAPKFKHQELIDRKDSERIKRDYIKRFRSHTQGIGLP